MIVIIENLIGIIIAKLKLLLKTKINKKFEVKKLKFFYFKSKYLSNLFFVKLSSLYKNSINNGKIYFKFTKSRYTNLLTHIKYQNLFMCNSCYETICNQTQINNKFISTYRMLNNILYKSLFKKHNINKVFFYNKNYLNVSKLYSCFSKDNLKVELLILIGFKTYVFLRNHIDSLLKVIKLFFELYFPELLLLCKNDISFVKLLLKIKSKKYLIQYSGLINLDGSLIEYIKYLAINSKGKTTNKKYLKIVMIACEQILRLESKSTMFLRLIKKAIYQLCPNLTILIGIKFTCTLLTKYIGIKNLSQLDSSTLCHIFRFYNKRYEAYDYLNIKFSKLYFYKIQRLYICKTVLCVRIDNFQKLRDSSYGFIFSGKIESYLSKLFDN